MKKINNWLALSKKIDTLSEYTGKVFSFIIIPLTLLIAYEVISRQLKVPTTWSFETSNFLFGAHFMLLAAFGLLYKCHCSIDLVTARVSLRAQVVLSLICYVTMFFPFVIMVLIYGIQYSATSWSMGEHSWSTWGPPLYHIKTVIPLTALLLLLQGVSEIIKIIHSIINEKGGK